MSLLNMYAKKERTRASRSLYCFHNLSTQKSARKIPKTHANHGRQTTGTPKVLPHPTNGQDNGRAVFRMGLGIFHEDRLLARASSSIPVSKAVDISLHVVNRTVVAIPDGLNFEALKSQHGEIARNLAISYALRWCHPLSLPKT